ncbi:MAG: sulfatase [Marinilabiliaceae bacterium]|nr:sulfatase [Marinilabiliaceae bacterium]
MQQDMFKLFSAGVLASVLLGACSTQKQESKPNVVFILVDDLGWTDLSVMGSRFYQTPNVDKLADRGTLFTNAYASCTVCSPTRASIMTGKYPATINCTDWIEGHKMPKAKLKVPEWTMYMDTAEFTLAEAFRDNGYNTGHIGKWHLGEDSLFWPENQGFDVNVGGWAKGSPHRNKKLGSNGYFAPFGNPRLTDQPDDHYLTERLANEACDYITQNHPDKTGKPFFLNFWLYSVHTPLQAKDDKIAKYNALVDSSYYQKNPVYAAMVEHMDDAVGKVISQLKKDGLVDNTIIVFTSDNGGLIGRGKRKVTNIHPLRNGKGHMYEGGVRVPLIIVDPRDRSLNGKSDEPVIACDFYPTLVDMAQLEIPDQVNASFDGLSLQPLLKGEKELSREALYWHYPHYHTEGARPYSAVRKGDWKLIRFFEDDHYELYNLKEDISESRDMAAIQPEKREELKQMLFNWYEKVGAQMPAANPNYDPENWKKR